MLGRHHGGGTAMAPRQRWSDFPPDELGWRTVRPFQKRTGKYTVCSCGKWTYDDKLAASGYSCKCGKNLAGAGGKQPTPLQTCSGGKPAAPAGGTAAGWEAAQISDPEVYKRVKELGLLPVDWNLGAGNGEPAPEPSRNQAIQAAVVADEKAKRALNHASKQLADAEQAMARKRTLLAEAAVACHEAKAHLDTIMAMASGAAGGATTAALGRSAAPLALGCMLSGVPEMADWKAAKEWAAYSSDPDICRKADGMYAHLQVAYAELRKWAGQLDGLVEDADKHGLGRGTVVAAAAAAVATAVDVDDEDVDVLDAGEMEAKTMAEDSNRSAEMPLAKRSCSGEAKKAEPPQEGQASTSTRAAELAQQAMQDAAKQVQAKLEAGAAAKPGGARAKKSGL